MAIFCFLGGTPTGQITDIDGGLRAGDDQAFVVLSFFCVGWLLVRCWVSGMTHVLLFLCDRLLHVVGRLLLGGLFCGVWVLCENWIVDASILFFCKFDFVKQFFCL